LAVFIRRLAGLGQRVGFTGKMEDGVDATAKAGFQLGCQIQALRIRQRRFSGISPHIMAQ